MICFIKMRVVQELYNQNAQPVLRAPLILAPVKKLRVFWAFLGHFRDIIMKVLTFQPSLPVDRNIIQMPCNMSQLLQIFQQQAQDRSSLDIVQSIGRGWGFHSFGTTYTEIMVDKCQVDQRLRVYIVNYFIKLFCIPCLGFSSIPIFRSQGLQKCIGYFWVTIGPQLFSTRDSY